MRHQKKGRKLGTDKSHTKAMKKSLVCALLLNDRIKTIESRAKEIRPDVDKIITWAKKGDLHSRRLAIAKLGDKDLVREIFEKVQQGMFKDRQGGYTRILKLGPRKGDDAPMVIMELVTEPVVKKTATQSTGKKATPKRVTPRKVEEEAVAANKTADKTDNKEPETIESKQAVNEQAVDGVAAQTEAWEEAAKVDQIEAVVAEGEPVKEGAVEEASKAEKAAKKAKGE